MTFWQFKGPLIFDIETGPLDDDELRMQFAFDPHELPEWKEAMTPFDPAAVKTGNCGPEKAAERIEKARQAHADLAWGIDVVVAAKEAAAFEEFRSKAALSPLTGKVLAIGMMDVASGRKWLEDGDGNEGELLTTFWAEHYDYAAGHDIKLIGFNSNQFDVPFLERRAMHHRIWLPSNRRDRRHYLSPDVFVDLREIWGGGDRNAKGSLDDVSRFLDGPAKNGDGALFYQMWNSPDDAIHNKAVEYALNDLDMTLAVAKGLQVL